MVSAPIRITSLSVEGFLPGGAAALAVASSSITFNIFADANNDGLPDGHPLSGTALWSHPTTASGLGVSTGASRYSSQPAPATSASTSHFWESESVMRPRQRASR